MGQTESGIIGTSEVTMIEVDVVQQIRTLRRLGWSVKRTARELGLSRNSVRKYRDEAVAVGAQLRPSARALTEEQVEHAVALFETTAAGNAVVVRDLLAEESVDVSLRTVQRHLSPVRQARRAAEAATTRFETAPGEQLQIDFGERKVSLGGVLLTVYFFVATLGFSRRLFVRAGLSQRQDDWKLGLESALARFGGRPRTVVVDNARALISEHTAERVVVHPAFRSYCEDRGLAVLACRPYRARTKGKVESGVKYVKRNGIAGRVFASLDDLQCHLEQWMDRADRRIHGTTHRRPIDLFHGAEAQALRPLHEPRLAVATQRLRRQVANDCFFDLDRTRYSVPHRLARCSVEVMADAEEVVAFHGGIEVARHRRGRPFERVADPRHFAGLHLAPLCGVAEPSTGNPLAALGRSLEQYAEIVGGAP